MNIVDNLRQIVLFTRCFGEFKIAALAQDFEGEIKVFEALLVINKRSTFV